MGAVHGGLAGGAGKGGALVAEQDPQGGVVAPLDDGLGDLFRHHGPLGDGLQVLLAVGAGEGEQVLFAQAGRLPQHRLGHGDGVAAEVGEQAGQGGGGRRQPARELHPHRLLHFAGDALHHLVEQGGLARIQAIGRLGEKQVGDLAQQFAAALAGGLARQLDQGVELGGSHG